MPVFGKKLKSSRHTQLDKRIINEKTARYVPKNDYHIFSSSLNSVSRNLKFDIKKWIKNRFNETKKKLVVLDWGCGNGKAIYQLSEKLSSIAKCYGYSADSSNEWSTFAHYSDVKFIHQTHDKLHRYFKDNSVDLIYSNYGLHYLIEDCLYESKDNFDKIKSEKMKLSLKNLFEKLNKDGLLITDYYIPSYGPNHEQLKELLEEILSTAKGKFTFEIKGGPLSKSKSPVIKKELRVFGTLVPVQWQTVTIVIKRVE